MAIFSNRNQRGQQRGSTSAPNNNEHRNGHSVGWCRRSGDLLSDGSGLQSGEVYNIEPRRSVSVHDNLPGSWRHKPNSNSKNNRGYISNRHNKYLYPVKALCLSVLSVVVAAPVRANVGGVSATANPIANSSGSVTNQAIQVLQGPYITNTYGGGIQCQGPTMNFTPYVTHSISDKDPFEQRYFEPQYDMSDFTGRTIQVQKTVKNWPWETWYDNRTYTNAEGEVVRAYEDGADMPIIVDEVVGDGIPDNPGSVVWEKPVRTGEKVNFNTNIGFSATMSFPLDGGLQERCKTAADTQIALQQQMTANKRLDFEIARLKNCGELMKAGIMFKPGTKYAAICADVIVMNKNAITQHSHSIPKPISSVGAQNATSSQPGSSDAVLQSVPATIVPGSSFPVRSQPSSLPSSQSVSQPLTEGQQEALRAVQRSSLPQQLRR